MLHSSKNDMGVKHKTAKVRITKNPSILARIGQVRSLSVSKQRENVDGLVAT